MRCKGLLRHLSASHGLVAGLLYGSGLRLMESPRLRAKDLDFGHGAIRVRDDCDVPLEVFIM